jgi:hypothetical protein
MRAVRDEWDNKKEELEKRLSDLLGEAWTFEVDPASLWPYGEENSYGKVSTGSMIYQYALLLCSLQQSLT